MKTSPFLLELHTVSRSLTYPTQIEDSSFDDFRQLLLDIDWEQETARASWARAGAPGIAVVDRSDGAKLWFAGNNWLAALVPGGGGTFRETTEFIVGLDQRLDVGCIPNRLVAEINTVENLFKLFYGANRVDLHERLSRFPQTDNFE